MGGGSSAVSKREEGSERETHMRTHDDHDDERGRREESCPLAKSYTKDHDKQLDLILGNSSTGTVHCTVLTYYYGRTRVELLYGHNSRVCSVPHLPPQSSQ